MAAVFGSSPSVFITVVGILGLLIGSFLNVVIYRLPRMLQREWRQQCADLLAADNAAGQPAIPVAKSEQAGDTFNLVTPRSACPACGTAIKAYQNVPIISYLLLKGRCANCAAKIPARYPVIEAMAGILSALIAWRFGYTLECAAALIMAWSLIALAVIDLDTQLLPDIITLPLLWLGLALSLFSNPEGSAIFTDPRSAIIGGIAGYLSLWSIYQGFKLVTGKEGMGYGDFKLLAALGTWLGWQMLLLIVLLSAVVGLVAALGMKIFRGHDSQIPIPFGPYLAAAGFIAMLWGPQILSAYLRGNGIQ
ncbi:MAG: A24 family peptidase [Gammaproteobacteria bacterium]|nr:A24 family peptidase [Gammaproteobacteria bacterium]